MTDPTICRMRRFRGGTIVFAVVVLTFLSTTPALAKERVAIACGPHASRVHPWRCFVTGYEGGGSLASVYLVHLRWSNWGGHAARAHGYIVDSETGTRSESRSIAAFASATWDTRWCACVPSLVRAEVWAGGRRLSRKPSHALP
jgi:hypothetical protein